MKTTSLLYASILSTFIANAEPSVYGMDTNSPNYKAQQTMQKNVSVLQQRLIEQEERIEGLRSIIEGLSSSVHALESKGSTTGEPTTNSTNASYMRLEAMIEELKNNYLKKSSATVQTNPTVLQAKSKPTSIIKPVLATSDKELFSQGVRHYLKKRYTQAKEIFVITDNKGYKAATSNYYLGEIAYYTKKYKDAIFFFKKSAGLNDKTTYIDILLLHTAVSLENSGEKAQAKAFYENIVANYKGKASASIASARLKNL
jgi:TolA-binding protein